MVFDTSKSQYKRNKTSFVLWLDYNYTHSQKKRWTHRKDSYCPFISFTAGFVTYWVKSIAMLLNLRNAKRIFSFVILFFWNSSLLCVLEVQVQVSTLFNKKPLLFCLSFVRGIQSRNRLQILNICYCNFVNKLILYFVEWPSSN